ncbi:hypothetical protein JCM19992_28180 [Thermostilla marina]
MKRWMIGVLALFVLACLLPTANASAMSRAQYREMIRSMPLLERPNRPGHIYGNTVRRLHAIRVRRSYRRGF